MPNNSDTTSGESTAEQKLVLVMPPDDHAQDELGLIDLWLILWRGKLTVIAVSALFAVASIAYALLATEWYKADVLLMPNEDNSMQSLAGSLGGLGSLAGFAGLNVGDNKSTESLAVLKSRDMARLFISDRGLETVLLHDEWDAEAGRWRSENEEDQPDIRDAVKYFDENVRDISRDPRTQLVTLSFTWTDPEVAAEWAMDYVARLNETMRQRALADAGRNVEFLQGELGTMNITTLRDSIGTLLEAELQKLMLARGNEEFAFRIVDAAEVPKLRDSPKRAIIVVISTILGGLLGLMVVLVRYAVARRDLAGHPQQGGTAS